MLQGVGTPDLKYPVQIPEALGIPEVFVVKRRFQFLFMVDCLEHRLQFGKRAVPVLKAWLGLGWQGPLL